MSQVKEDFKIIFMGTPGFAIPSLQQLLNTGYSVVGVITAPDKPAGRGQKLKASPVKKFAQKHDLNILQPENLKDPDFLEKLKSLNPDLNVVVAFRMLPEQVFDLPPHGSINLHASLLPAYRGAAPINWVIINGETKTGLTTFFIGKQIDTGEIIYQEEEPIEPKDTAGTLHDRLMEKGGELVVKTVDAIREGDPPTTPQPKENDTRKAPKIHKSDCEIDWQQPIEEIYNFIRGLSPYPVAWTTINDKMFRVFWAKPEPENLSISPGTIKTDQKSYFKVAGEDGWLSLKEIQMAGKKRMAIDEFLRGNKIQDEQIN